MMTSFSELSQTVKNGISFPARLKLSVRGEHLERRYRAHVPGAIRLGALERRSSWARIEGLDAADGFYLAELGRRSLTLNQIGEAVAIYSHCGEMARATITRLIDLGVIELAPAT